MLTALLIFLGLALPVGFSLVPGRVWSTMGLSFLCLVLWLMGALMFLLCVYELVVATDPWASFSWALATGYLAVLFWKFRGSWARRKGNSR